MYRKHKAKHFDDNNKINNTMKSLIFIIMTVIILLNRTGSVLSYFTSSASITNVFTIAGTYIVEFDSNGGDGTMQNQEIFCGVQTSLNTNTFTRTDYYFTGWNTASDGSGKAIAMLKLYRT